MSAPSPSVASRHGFPQAIAQIVHGRIDHNVGPEFAREGGAVRTARCCDDLSRPKSLCQLQGGHSDATRRAED
jgi:hypothetical protein